MIPGEYLLASTPIEANAGRPTVTLPVANLGDRPVQIGSHCHFFEVNRWLAFDWVRAYGMRLNIPAGTAVRFEPGDTREVELVALGGTRHVHGINGLVNGLLDDETVRRQALERVRDFAVSEGNPVDGPGGARRASGPHSGPRDRNGASRERRASEGSRGAGRSPDEP